MLQPNPILNLYYPNEIVQKKSPQEISFLSLFANVILENQKSKLDENGLEKLSQIKVKASHEQIASLGIDPSSSSNIQQGQQKTINLDQIQKSLSSDSIKGLDKNQTSARLKTALELYNQYFQENFSGEEYNELRDHLNKKLLSSPNTTNLHNNIDNSTDLAKIKQACNEIGEFFSIIALKVEAIKSSDQAIDGTKEKEELKTILMIFPSNQDADYACLDGTRQRLQTGTFALLKPDVITQLLEQEIDIFVAKHSKEVDEGNQIHMKVCLYGVISGLPSAELAKIDGFHLNPQNDLQLKDVSEFFDNLEDKIIKGLKTRISQIELQLHEIFGQEHTANAGQIKDFNNFLKTNGFNEINDKEFYRIFYDENYLLRKDIWKQNLNQKLQESITEKYPTLDIEKLKELFAEVSQQQYLSPKIDLFYDGEQSSKQLDTNKIGNLLALFCDNSAGASQSHTLEPEPNIANITKGLVILRNVAQDFKNSNPFYFLEFFKQFAISTGKTFEDYFFEPSLLDQSQPLQQREIKKQFKELEGIIKDIATREKNLSDILLQKPADQTIPQSQHEITQNQEIFEVCNAIFLGKEDEESKKQIQAFKEKLMQDSNLANATYSFFLEKENIFFKKLIENDNDIVLKKLIDILPEVKKQQLKEYKPNQISNLLHIASQKGSNKVIKVLMNADFIINEKNNLGDTALMIASKNGHTSVVEELINFQAEVDLKNIFGNTALMIALQNGHIEVVMALIKGGTNLDLENGSKDTALMIASKNGHASVVEALIDGGADVNLKDNYEDTALMIASKNGHASVVQELIKGKADVNLQDNCGDTALISALQNGHISVVETLIEKEAKVDLIGSYRKTALMIASHYGFDSVVKALIERGADVNLQDIYEETAVMIASKNDHASVVETLLQNGDDLKKIDDNFLQLIQSTDIKNTIQKYKVFYQEKDHKNILTQIERSLNEYLNNGKALTESSKIKVNVRNQQDQEIELNFNAISKIYKKENKVSCLSAISCLGSGLTPTKISDLISKVEINQPSGVTASTLVSADRLENARGLGL